LPLPTQEPSLSLTFIATAKCLCSKNGKRYDEEDCENEGETCDCWKLEEENFSIAIFFWKLVLGDVHIAQNLGFLEELSIQSISSSVMIHILRLNLCWRLGRKAGRFWPRKPTKNLVTLEEETICSV
jgi:hypothetical protein